MQGRTGRLGGIGLGGFGVALGALMFYSLAFEGAGCSPRPEPAGLVDVPVFFRERSEWRIFARGVSACVDEARGLGQVVYEEDDLLIVETTKNRRPVRFTWQNVRGEWQSRDALHRRLAADRPPVAVIGSSNSVLTAALATQLRAEAGAAPGKPAGGGPLLLVPWATSVSLLGIYQGRTFRFCSDNRRAAALLVDCLKARPGATGPSRVVLVVDPLDPYSTDLAGCVRAEAARAFPEARVVDLREGVSAVPRLSSTTLPPTATEGRRAREIWRELIEGSEGETLVVLPLQQEPARRMIVALNAAAPGRHDARTRPLTVACGDAVGPTTLAGFANQLVFPVWSVSTAGELSASSGVEEDVQDLAEVIAAVLIGLDRPGPPPSPDDLRAGLLRPGGIPSAPFGRPVAFGDGGERLGHEPGEILALQPDSPRVLAYPAGRWAEPRPIEAGGAP